MFSAHDFLSAMTVVLCVAAVTTVLFQRLRQPVVLGYILAGLIVGPYVPIPLIADRQVVAVLSELGVILLMFSLGLEFSLRKLVQVGPTAVLTATIQSGIMIWLGFMLGQAFGWTTRESLFAGAIIAISSTTIIAKAFDEQGVQGRLRELVVGVLIVEDLIAILLMAMLTAIASGDSVSATTILVSSGRLAAFLAGLLIVGLLVVPRTVRAVTKLKRDETLLVASIGICFAFALLAHHFGYSVALGAFLAGSLIAESGEEKKVEHLIMPVRDMFAAIFFVSVGMLIDPAKIAEHWGAVAAFTAVVIAGKVVGVTLGAFFTGCGTRTSVQAGMSLAQIGEFSFIIAALGISLKATGDFLYPIAVAVSALTTLTTPWLIRKSGPVAAYVDRKLPPRLQTFAALYGNWIEHLGRRARPQTTHSASKRLVRLLVLDVLVLMAILIAAAAAAPAAVDFASRKFSLSPGWSRMAVLATAALLAAPFLVGLYRIVRKLGVALAESALPEGANPRMDLGAAPRRVLVLALQMGIVLPIGALIAAFLQPFLPPWVVAPALGVVWIALGVNLWRSALNLQGHVKAGAEMVVEALMLQSKSGGSPQGEAAFRGIEHLLVGLGDPVSFRIEAGDSAVGRSLTELNLRGLTGATVLGIVRGQDRVIVPEASEVLRIGDLLALVGTEEAVEAAKSLLRTGAPSRAT